MNETLPVLRRLLTTVLMLLLLMALGPAPAAAGPGGARDLRILLTNDDGHDFPALEALRGALTSAGHQVTVVAPRTDQSGTGTALTVGTGADASIRAREVSPGTWWVDGSPGDAVKFGLAAVFGHTPPDLIISGPNPGQNIGTLVNHSGTVGATVAAVENGVPAISLSAEADLSSQPPTVPTLPQAIDFGVRLIAKLQSTAPRGHQLLPANTTLNVVYPAHPNGKVRVTQVGRSQILQTRYVADPDLCPDCFRIVTLFEPTHETVARADTTALKEGYVSITPMDGDWTAASWVARSIKTRIDGLHP